MNDGYVILFRNPGDFQEQVVHRSTWRRVLEYLDYLARLPNAPDPNEVVVAKVVKNPMRVQRRLF